ncbi:Histone H4 family and Histone core domain and Histone-fold domain-containing protein [Aphelenchoides besseyi]|nr:Histone H4 family and Histone core domain and Histone-fold domain-containing protein [Aphelenchoides besseyi]
MNFPDLVVRIEGLLAQKTTANEEDFEIFYEEVCRACDRLEVVLQPPAELNPPQATPPTPPRPTGRGSGRRKRKVLRDNLQGITKPAIRRLARRGSLKRIFRLVYEETRSVLKSFLENVIRDAVSYCEHGKRKTITAMDIVFALKRQGRILYGFVVRIRRQFELRNIAYTSGKQRAIAIIAQTKCSCTTTIWLEAFELAKKTVLKSGQIMPDRYEDAEYNEALENSVLFGKGKNRLQMEVPEDVAGGLSSTYIFTSKRKGFSRFRTKELEKLIEVLEEAEKQQSCFQDAND